MNEQKTVYDAIKARGYVKPHSDPRNILVRQVVKLMEELGELADNVSVILDDQAAKPAVYLLEDMRTLGEDARACFDEDWFAGPRISDPDEVRKELADLQVVLFVAAETMGFDVVEAAVEKSRRDVGRGVRVGQPN